MISYPTEKGEGLRERLRSDGIELVQSTAGFHAEPAALEAIAQAMCDSYSLQDGIDWHKARLSQDLAGRLSASAIAAHQAELDGAADFADLLNRYYAILESHPSMPVPQVITAFQAKAALLQTGALQNVQAMIASLPESDLVRLAWETNAGFERYSPAVNAIGGALGLDLDALFVLGAGIAV